MIPSQRTEGFTLIEIMISIVILTMISLLLWQSTAVLMTGKQRYEAEDIRFHEALLALSRIADDLSMAYLYQSRDHLGSTGLGEVHREIRFLGRDKGGQDELIFAAFSNVRYVKGSKEDEQSEITYYLKQVQGDEGNHFDLVKRTQAPPDSDPEHGGIEYVILEDVKEFNLQFYDVGKKEWRREWDSNSLESNKRLPRAVEINLVVADLVVEGETRSFTTTALLEMAPGPNDF